MFQFPRFAFDPYEFRIKYFVSDDRGQTTGDGMDTVRPLSSDYCRLEVGFPIRKSADQSFLAAPRGLSQRSTSFIASQRQGIHRIPLRHLIALITNAHRSAATALLRKAWRGVGRKDQFCFKHIRERCGQAAPTTEYAQEIHGRP